jgi:poly(glycerol-phosphate) alpha-glucosyltransferase
MINGGNADMAKQILEQYTMLNSTDPEIPVIKNILYPDGISTDAEDKTIPDDYKALNKIETIFILSGIITRRTGYIDSVLRKIKLMEDKWSYKPLLLTCIHNIDQRQALTWLQTAGEDKLKMSNGTRVVNVFEYFQKSYAEGLESIAIYAPVNDGAEYVKTSESTYDVFDNDVCIRQEYYTGYAGCLRMVRYLDNEKKDKDLIYDDWGYLNYIRLYDSNDDRKFHVDYYTTDGDICIKAYFEFTDQGAMPDKYIVYNQSGAVIGECKGSDELAALYLNQTITDDKYYMLVVEDGLMSKAATKIDSKKKNVAKCAVVHSIFLNDAYDLKSCPQMYYKYLCENYNLFDGIIMLTQSASDDFQKIYGKVQNIFVIPHPYPYETDKSDFGKTYRKNAVSISRLDPLKQINYAVDIFSLVVNEIPDAKLEIYGRGPEEKQLEKQIKRLKLENNVLLMGYTDTPLPIFKNAALSIFTSGAEGFGLTLIESICNGCPAFAFDIKYGPSEIIEDGQTGYLIPRFDKEKYAKKIISFYKDEQLQKEMSENCYNSAMRFSADRFLENWYSMTINLLSSIKEKQSLS